MAARLCVTKPNAVVVDRAGNFAANDLNVIDVGRRVRVGIKVDAAPSRILTPHAFKPDVVAPAGNRPARACTGRSGKVSSVRRRAKRRGFSSPHCRAGRSCAVVCIADYF